MLFPVYFIAIMPFEVKNYQQLQKKSLEKFKKTAILCNFFVRFMCFTGLLLQVFLELI